MSTQQRRYQARLPEGMLGTPSLFMHAASRGRMSIPRHIEVIEDAVLDAIAEGDVNLTIEAPVRTGKSTYLNRYLSSWYLGSFPTRHVGLASHESSFAAGWGAKARDDLIEFGSSFGIGVSRDNRSRSEWEIAHHGGGMRSVGIKGGGITGRGFHLFILDDLIKNAADAESEAVLEAQWDFLRGTAMTRMEPRVGNEPGGVLIVTMARWNEADLIGRIHKELPGQFKRIRLPALAEEPSEEFPEPDLLGRAPGEPLWPERFPIANLERRRHLSGEYFFNALYQQRPGSAAGTIFQRTWWKRWNGSAPTSFDFSAWSWDMSFKDKSDSSFVVGQCWGVKGADFFLRRQVRGQWSFSATKEILKREIARPELADARSTVLIEDKANGTAIIDDLKHDVGGLIPVATGTDSKTARARSIAGYVEAGNVHLPDAGTPESLDQDGNYWVEGYIDEHARFPRGAHDDQVDTTSQALRELLDRGGGGVWVPTGELPEREGTAWGR